MRYCLDTSKIDFTVAKTDRFRYNTFYGRRPRQDQGVYAMPKTSSKPDKTMYMTVREGLALTREKASELICTQCISEDRLEKIENRRLLARPDEILAIAEAYKAPALINYYCTHDCDIGGKYISEVKPKELSQIAIETLNSLNRLSQVKDRLLEIVEDGTISEDELEDFCTIKSNLDKIARAVESLQLWLNESIARGNIDLSMISR